MKITEEEIKDIAAKASLNLNDEEVREFAADFKKISNFAEKLKEVDTSSIDDIQLPGEVSVLRKDKVKPSLDKAKVLANAPEKKDGCFFVPAVMD